MTGAGGTGSPNPGASERSGGGPAAVRGMPPGTVVRLPDEHGGRVGYKHYTHGEASHVLVPEAGRLEPVRVGLPPGTEVEVLATPCELADAYVRRRAADGRTNADRRRRGPAGRVVELRPVGGGARVRERGTDGG